MSSSAPSAPPTVEITNAASPVKQLSIFMHNQVGAFLALVRLLNDHHIEVLGFSVQDSIDLTLVRVVVTDPETAKSLFDEQGLSCAIKTIVVAELREGLHDLAHALMALLEAEINIHHSYPLLTMPGGKPLLALCVDDADVAQESLSRCGFKLLSQGDLSR